MSNTSEYKDIVAFHPGYYIADIIEDMGISQAEFAARLGTNTKTLSCLVNGQANITNDLAKKMSVLMGTSPDVWLNLQNAYDQKVIEIQQAKDFEAQANIVGQIDYKFFIEVAGLPNEKTINAKIARLCSWLKVSDLRIMMKPDFLVNYRTGVSSIEEKNIINSRAWIQTAVNLSNQIETKPYSAERLKSYLPEIRSMTVQTPKEFLPRLKEILAECGVAFVLLPHLKNSGVNGAVKWMSDERVVLAMNNRRLDADIFWFSLFHEIRHVLQRKIKTVFVSCGEKEMVEMNEQFEKEADIFATNYLIPLAAMNKLSPTPFISDAEIIEFAKKLGIHPGIVAGRLQHDGILKPNRAAKFKVKYDINNCFMT